MKAEPLVSIVTVVLNECEYLEETIISVIEQDYSNIQYIIIDGGSKDGTLSVIKKYDENIDFWMSEPDNGIYDAMNKGIDRATGEWINFMNAGDTFYAKDVVKKIFLQRLSDIDIVYGDTQFIYEKGYSRVLKVNDVEEIWKGIPFYHQSTFVKTALARQNKFDTTYKITSDYNFLFNAYNKRYRFKNTGIVVSRMRTGGLSYSEKVKAFIECRQIVRKHIPSVKIEIYFFLKILKVRIDYSIRKLVPDNVFLLLLKIRDKAKCKLMQRTS